MTGESDKLRKTINESKSNKFLSIQGGQCIRSWYERVQCKRYTDAEFHTNKDNFVCSQNWCLLLNGEVLTLKSTK